MAEGQKDSDELIASAVKTTAGTTSDLVLPPANVVSAMQIEKNCAPPPTTTTQEQELSAQAHSQHGYTFQELNPQGSNAAVSNPSLSPSMEVSASNQANPTTPYNAPPNTEREASSLSEPLQNQSLAYPNPPVSAPLGQRAMVASTSDPTPSSSQRNPFPSDTTTTSNLSPSPTFIAPILDAALHSSSRHKPATTLSSSTTAPAPIASIDPSSKHYPVPSPVATNSNHSASSVVMVPAPNVPIPSPVQHVSVPLAQALPQDSNHPPQNYLPTHPGYTPLRYSYHQYITPYKALPGASPPGSHNQQQRGNFQNPGQPSTSYQQPYLVNQHYGPPTPTSYHPQSHVAPIWDERYRAWMSPFPQHFQRIQPAPVVPSAQPQWPNHSETPIGPGIQQQRPNSAHHSRETTPTSNGNAISEQSRDSQTSSVRFDAVLPPKKRGRPKKQQGEGQGAQQDCDAPVKKRRTYKKKKNDSEGTPQADGIPVLKKRRTYKKKGDKAADPSQVDEVTPAATNYIQSSMPPFPQYGPWPFLSQQNSNSQFGSPHHPNLQAPTSQDSFLPRQDSTHQSVVSNSDEPCTPSHVSTPQRIAVPLKSPTPDITGDNHALSEVARGEFESAPIAIRQESRVGIENHDFVVGWDAFASNNHDGNAARNDEDTLIEDLSGDEEEFEDNAVYSSIMSQVSRYTGKPANKRGRRAKRRLEEFLGFTETAREEEPEGDQLAPAKSEAGPKPKRLIKHRGPRIAAEPTGEIKMRLGLANEAFQESNIEEARRVVDEIIRINAETYEAWNLLSSIFEEQGLREDALMALIVAAHLRPKHVEAWFNAADYALTSMGTITPKLLRDVDFCLSSAVRQVPSNLEARIRKAQVLVMRENFNKAATDYKYILRSLPNNLDLIRELGAVYVDLGDGRAGVELYQKAFEHFKNSPDDFELSIDWNDLHSYAVLYSYIDKKSEEALKETKALARWLLGREDETYWDEVTENDCEWDIDDTRRSSVVQYSYGEFPLTAYGEGLPIELRVYFGKFRLNLGHFEEALKHFSYLFGKNDETSEPIAQTYPDLVLHVADSLYDMQKLKEALPFYQALKQTRGQNSAELCIQIGKCLLHEDHTKAAEEVLREACLLDEKNIEARVELARMYEKMDESEQAFVFVNQILTLESANRPKIFRRRKEMLSDRPPPSPPAEEQKSFVPPTIGASARLKREKKLADKILDREALAEHLRQQYVILRGSSDSMRNGDRNGIDSWMDAARTLTEDFRSCIAFYPWDRKEFGGYSAEEQITAQMNLNMDVKALAQQHEQNIGSQDPEAISTEVPNHYRGINFRDWVEIFCEYALCLARRGRGREAYDICEAATHAICFCFSKSDMFVIHLTYCSCALMANDEETCVAMARWFMTQYQFATDSYRMFAALMRMCHSPISWYSSGPTQKFILRQIKTVDYALCNPVRKQIIHKDKASYTNIDKNGQPVVNDELDINLLMIYGHILIAGASYLYALNYFHRALTQDPDNPMILLSLGLSYVQYALKRQIDNRQYAVMQGFTFMHRYYEIRSQSKHFVERQEGHYNMARSYHLVGLTNLAIPYYRKVLKAEGRKRDELGGFGVDGSGKRDADEAGTVEDMCVDTAYNLQTIYTVAGNYELAEKVTRKWLVI